MLEVKSHYDNEIKMVTHQGLYTSDVRTRSKNIMVLNRLVELFVIIAPCIPGPRHRPPVMPFEVTCLPCKTP